MMLPGLLLLLSCSESEPGPCECDGQPSGMKCREIVYNENGYIGYLDFFYTKTDLLKEKVWYPASGTEKHVSYVYDSAGKILEEDIRYGDDREAEWLYEYNEYDSLSKKTYFENGQASQVIIYEYNEQFKLSKRSSFEEGSIRSYVKYTYDENGSVWRLEYFDEASSLQKQLLFEYFSNNTSRIEEYGPGLDYKGYKFINRNSDGTILEVKEYDPDRELVEYVLNDVRDGRVNRSSRYDADGDLLWRTVYLYY